MKIDIRSDTVSYKTQCNNELKRTKCYKYGAFGTFWSISNIKGTAQHFTDLFASCYLLSLVWHFVA